MTDTDQNFNNNMVPNPNMNPNPLQANNPNSYNVSQQQGNDVPESQLTNTEKTINYYKFLLYSLKVEMKTLEFFNILRASSNSEIGLWILSACILASIPKTLEITSQEFVWFHLTHIARGVLGYIILFRLPKTYDLIDSMEDDVTQTKDKTYNEILREVGKREIIPKIEKNKCILIFYMILTFVSLIIDVIDFIASIGSIDPNAVDKNYKYITFAYLAIALMYICKK